MNAARLSIAISMAWFAVAPARAGFDEDFTGNTLRIDIYHSGTAAEEHIALERIRVEGVWAGSRTQPLDASNLGQYRIEVADAVANRTLYSRGFCSIYGEWETIAEAREGVWRTFPEALRIPEPRRLIQVRLLKRASTGDFREIWRTTVDPAAYTVERPASPAGDSFDVVINGPVELKADLVILGDGYTADEKDKFRDDAWRAVESLFAIEPFAARKSDFNVRAVFTPARESGITEPRKGVFRESPLGVRSNVFETERYALTFDDRAWRDAAAAVPYDFTIILINGPARGGGGIHNLYALAEADSPSLAFLLAHEFGHHFAGLADEYYTASVAYEMSDGNIPEPWEPNVTALHDPAKLKWADLVVPGTPLPTPWNKAEFERGSAEWQRRIDAGGKDGSAAESETARQSRRDWYDAFFAASEYASKVGAFEGAMYRPRGLYRPCLDCIMHTWGCGEYCPVCRRAIERMIDFYSR